MIINVGRKVLLPDNRLATVVGFHPMGQGFSEAVIIQRDPCDSEPDQRLELYYPNQLRDPRWRK